MHKDEYRFHCYDWVICSLIINEILKKEMHNNITIIPVRGFKKAKQSTYFKGCKSPDFPLSFLSFVKAGGLRSIQVPTLIKRHVNNRGNCLETSSVISSDQNSS